MSGKSVRLISVFVSSPGDVARERQEVDNVVARINDVHGEKSGFVLKTWKWEQHARPRLGKGDSAQKAIDDQTPEYDVYVGILSSCFGTPTQGFGSGTEKEFRDALTRREKVGRPEVLFYFRKSPPAPKTAAEGMEFLRVLKFKEEIGGNGLYGVYDDVEHGQSSFAHKLQQHLTQVVFEILSEGDAEKPEDSPDDPTRYLQWLHRKCSRIDIRGLNVGTGEVHHLPIEELYVNLRTALPARDSAVSKEGRMSGDMDRPDSQDLQRALREPRVVVVGDPGAGKTTFLRRATWELCRIWLDEFTVSDEWRELQQDSPRLPLLISLTEVYDEMVSRRQGVSTLDTTACCLPEFLGAVSAKHGWGLGSAYFESCLKDGKCIIMLDGLDEAPDRLARKSLVELIENIARSYPECRLLVTSRPAAFIDEVVLPQPEFFHARIEPLDDSGVESFLNRWCRCLYSDQPLSADEHCRELLTAFRAKPEIRRMARNPVMLTALAVVHWNQQSLPEQRAELYKSVLRWLARSREMRVGRMPSEGCLKLLRELAFAMQDHPKGVQRQVSNRWAGEVLAAHFDDDVERAEAFLEEERNDSGILVGRGNQLQFWHRTFQEYLAALAISAWKESRQVGVIKAKWRVPEWREVLLLLAGVLHDQGEEKVDGLFENILDTLGKNPELTDAARAAGLLGGMVRDLTPLKYEPPQEDFKKLLVKVMAIFDKQQAQELPTQSRIDAADAMGQAGDPRIDPLRSDYWADFPSGEFCMGSQKDDASAPNYEMAAYDDELPAHRVWLGAFTLARYPVTVGQYREFVEDDGYEDNRWWKDGGFREFSSPEKWENQIAYPTRPVTGVSWYEAAAFCAWQGVRLPTEAEWERAARGIEGRKYPWGDQEPDKTWMNFSEAGIGHPTPVGVFPRDVTPEGVLDMGGNVLEWCLDGRRDYDATPQRDPVGPQEVACDRVFRGGGWAFVAGSCRAAFRGAFVPARRFGSLGFRLAAVPLGGAGSKKEK